MISTPYDPQGESGPAGPSGAAGTRGVPVSLPQTIYQCSETLCSGIYLLSILKSIYFCNLRIEQIACSVAQSSEFTYGGVYHSVSHLW